MKVAVLGGTGYTALELIQLLLRHPHVEIAAITTRQETPQTIAQIHPSLGGRINLLCEPFDADRLVEKGIQVVFGCLPHGASAELLVPLLERGIKVIDLSADFRLRSAAEYQRWYGDPHPAKHLLGEAVYGVPEIYGQKLPGARLVANPGCYPQTGILGLAPLVANGLIEQTGIIVNSLSGISGAGRSPKLTTLFPECNESIVAYNVGKHRHTPEMEQALSDVAGSPVEVIFTPHLAPMNRGIHSTIYAVPTKSILELQLRQLYQDYYKNHRFIRVRDVPPASKDTVNTNYTDIAVHVVRGKIIILVTLDNLIRGASGVAVQNFNHVHGFAEELGLQ